jgi:HicB family
MSQVALRLPDSLHLYAKQMAARDDASLNQFIVMAVAEKISAFNTATFFAERGARSNRQSFDRVMRKVKVTAPLAGDERN